MTDTKALEERIKSSGLKKGFISEVIGISRQGFDKKCKNQSEFKAGEIDILCDLLSISTRDRMAIFFAK